MKPWQHPPSRRRQQSQCRFFGDTYECDSNAGDTKAGTGDTVFVNSARHKSEETPIAARTLLALNVIRLRRRNGWSQDVLARESELHRTFVAHVEREARNISLDNIERLALALGVQTYELLKPPRLRKPE